MQCMSRTIYLYHILADPIAVYAYVCHLLSFDYNSIDVKLSNTVKTNFRIDNHFFYLKGDKVPLKNV